MASDLQTVHASFGTLGDFDDPEPLVSGLVDSLLEEDPAAGRIRSAPAWLRQPCLNCP